MSYASIRPRYPWGCPTCGVPAFEHCRTLRTGKVTDTHMARLTRPANQ